MPGYFITFEGGEGSGKTTQVKRLAERLRAAGIEVVTTREPGGTPGADAIRHVVLSGAAKRMGPQMEGVLFAAARCDHLDQLIMPALTRGATVICDRFHDSTRVYQSTGNPEDDAFLTRLERATLAGLSPDLTILLDVPASLGAKRATARRGNAAPDRFEAEDGVLHEARRARFLAIAEDEPARCIVIDGALGEDDIAEAIFSTISERHPELGKEPVADDAGDDADRVRDPR